MTTEQVERLADAILEKARELAARRPDEQVFMRAIGELIERTFPDYRDRQRLKGSGAGPRRVSAGSRLEGRSLAKSPE
jgi:hypothetical protein